MKRSAFLTLALVAISLIGFSQINPRTIGVRLGGGSFVGGEISYQQKMGSANRAEFDLGFGASDKHTRIYLVGIYHWLWNIEGGLNWYVGPGVGAGLYTYDNNDGFINIAVGGQIGIEYDFSKKDVPFVLSLDARPMWDFLGDNAGLGWGAALGIRYVLK